ncbi:MAG: chemotaxis protein CheA [Nitrospirae bacterium]|nr:chemotaxis protein CheA [Nitrospirota bacterium]
MFDSSQFYEVFIEEANEKLAELEDGLLRLEKDSRGGELINTIFRAAHTIKGSSGTLGLDEMSKFTHSMEELLDLMRSDVLRPETDVISILLEATDRLKDMVAAFADRAAFDYASCSGLVDRMARFLSQPDAPQSGNMAAEPSGQVSASRQDTGRKEGELYRIIFVPDPGILKRGADPLLIFDDLRENGDIVDIKADLSHVPALSGIDPESLHIRWDITLKTGLSAPEIRSMFEFVEDGSEIRILPVSAIETGTPLLGRMLVEEGIVRSCDLDEALKAQKKLGDILVEQGKAAREDIEKVARRQGELKADTARHSVSSTIRVDLRKLDTLINAVGEMVIIHSMFQQEFHGHSEAHGRSGAHGKFDALFSQLQRIGGEIQDSVMSLRMLPVGDVFNRFTRLVRELSASRNKSIELVISGEDTELDKGVLEKITDPLVHLIRNSIDHGLESPEARAAAGKPPRGMLHLSAYQMGDSVYIDVEDDGRGLNRDRIIEKAVQRGIITSAAGMTEDQINELIFLPGFSTAEKVSDVSGRGVGMDVVRKNIETLNGRVHIRTSEGVGTSISIKLPLTLAIIDGLKVLVGSDTFIIPVTSVVEMLRPARDDVKSLGEKGEMIHVRGEYVPLVRLQREFGTSLMRGNPWEAVVVVVSHEKRKKCLLVDELLGEQQVVIKNLGTAMPKLDDIAGGTILGDGTVALVLDVPGIIERRTCATA